MAIGRTSEEYLEDMLRLGKEDARTGLIPRDDCAPLGNFVRRLLARRTATQTAPPPVTLDQGDTDFVSIYTIRPGGVVASTFDCGRRIEPGQGPENHDPSNIVVLRGYPHLRSLCEVGAAYDIPTALYQRHLHYLTFNNAGSSTLSALPVLPALPAKTAIFQLTLTTIFYHGSSRLPTSRLGEVDGLRRRCADQLGSYHRDLARCEAAPGDSVVHQYSLLSDTLSAIDQTITIGIIPTSTSWTAVVWMDSARDLEHSFPGPWRRYVYASATGLVSAAGATYSHAAQPQRDRLGLPSLSTARGRTDPTTGAADFPRDMGQFFSKPGMGCDALYALSSVLHISAASQRQLLSVLWGLLDAEMDHAGRVPSSPAPMANVCYLKKVADRHVGRLGSTVLILENRDETCWSRAAPGTPEREEADRAVTMLLRDFAHLQEEAQRLSASLGESMQFLASNASFLESVKGISNARRVERLTLLATIFLPLTFTCSAFGMNFSLFGQGELSIWIYFPAAAIVVGASFLAWYFSSGEHRSMWTCV